MPNTETLSDYATRVGLVLRFPEQDGDKIRNSNDTDVIQFTYPHCGHEYGPGSMIKNLPLNPTLSCKKCARNNKFEAEKRLRVNYSDQSIECLDCERVYYREDISYNIAQFKCYCKKNRRYEHALYDILVELYGAKAVYRSTYWGRLALHDGKRIYCIFNLDDAKSRCFVSSEDEAHEHGVIFVRIDKKTLIEYPEWVAKSINDAIEDGSNVALISKNEGNYGHLEKNFRETRGLKVFSP